MADVEKRENGSESPASYDKEEEDVQVQWTVRRFIAISSLCGVYVGAQAILYFASGGLSYIAESLDTQIPNWLLTANTLAVAAICPFVGYLTDLFGRRWLTILGSIFLVISSAVMGTAKDLPSGLVAQAFGGIGAGICELTALAGVAEITPVRWRGVSIAFVTFSILPFIPALIYIQLLELYATWRWAFLICGGWNVLSGIGLLICYKPPPRHNAEGLTKMDILKRIDYFGAFLSIAGVTLFLTGLEAAGYQYPPQDPRVLGPLISGIILILVFPIWEWKGAKYPMVPPDIFRGQRVVLLAYAIVFVAGMNFYSVLGFFPIMLQTLYPYNPITIGIRGLGYPFAILAGACVINGLMSYTKGHVRQMFFAAAAIMTAFCGALAASTPHNPGFATAMATLASFGIGGIIVPSLTLAFYACPDAYIGTTAALSLSVRFLGGAVGTAIYFNIYNQISTRKVPEAVGKFAQHAGLPPSELMKWVPAFIKAVMADPTGQLALKIPGSTQKIVEAAALGYSWGQAESLKYVWYTTIAFGGLSMICAAAIPNIRTYMSNRVAVDIH